MRTYGEMRRTYVSARLDEQRGVTPPSWWLGNWRQYQKDEAHREFNEFVAEQRRQAVAEYEAQRAAGEGS